MSEPVNPLALELPALLAWCAAEGVSYAGMFALRQAAQLSTAYRWDPERRLTVASRLGEPDVLYPHDWLERALDARDASRAAAAAERAAAELAAQAAIVAPVVAPVVAPPSPAPALAPAARRPPVRSAPQPAAPKVEQLGLFGGRR